MWNQVMIHIKWQNKEMAEASHLLYLTTVVIPSASCLKQNAVIYFSSFAEKRIMILFLNKLSR